LKTQIRLLLLLVTLFLTSCVEGQSSTRVGTVPTSPISYVKEKPFTITVNGVTSWVYVPNGYDDSHQTPMPLFVWLHGCGGRSQYDVAHVSPGGSNQTWITLAVGGREGACWSSADVDGGKVLSAIQDLSSHFNVNSRKVMLGGYSSGGDIGYLLAFRNANLFSGLLFVNTAPSAQAMQAASTAAWKLNIVQLSHVSDTTYPIAGVRSKMDQLKSLGFPVTLIEKPGTHWDTDTGTSGTLYDIRTYGLPYIRTGWSIPLPVCAFTYSPWTECFPDGTRTRTVSSKTPTECDGNPTLKEACTYVPPVCTTWEYGEWTTCNPTGTQTRVVTSASPTFCVGGSPVVSQSCTYIPPDADKDGVEDTLDACPSVAGVKTSDPSTNGCLKLVVSSKKTYDWGSGYCRQFSFRNPNPMKMKWVAMQLRLGDGKLRGPGAVWGGIFTDPYAKGTIIVTPAAWTSPVPPNSEIQTVGFCADYGPQKTQGTSGGLTY
jgi:pimeloyl-ACP methyl ester carboxylesterase